MVDWTAPRALFLVGLVLLPGPIYGAALGPGSGPSRSPNGYVASPATGGEIARNCEEPAAFHVQALTDAGSSTFEQPERTLHVLEQARANETVAVTNASTKADVRHIETESDYVRFQADYYDLRLAESNGSLQVTTEYLSATEMAEIVGSDCYPTFGSLAADEQATFEKILAAGRSADSAGYRPWPDEPVPDSRLVEYQGTVYRIEQGIHVDDFGFGPGIVIGFLASLLGVVLIALAGVVWLYQFATDG